MSKGNVELDRGKRIFPQNKVQINVMNPHNQDNSLVGREWSNPGAINYPKVNKACVKSIVQQNRDNVKIRKVIDEVEESKEPFKMACWEKVEPKIKVKELEDHPADFYKQ